MFPYIYISHRIHVWYKYIWAPRVFRAPHICVIWTRHLIEAIDIATADEMLTLHEGFYRPLAFSK